MTQGELKEKIKSGNIGGAYLFAGDEDYLKKYYAGQIKNAVLSGGGLEIFCHSVFDGDEVALDDVREAISSAPMMADYKLVEWRYPDIESMSEGEKKKLEELALFTRDYPYCALVITVSADGLEAGTVKRPSKLAARLGKCFELVNFEKSTDAALVGWLKRHFDSEGVSVDAKTLHALIFRSGHVMQVLMGEVGKLCAYAKANSLAKITESEVNLVASATLECDAFALSGAISDKNRERAFVALMDMKMRRIESGAVLATLCRAFVELLTVAMLIDEGMSAQDIERTLKWNAYKIKLCISAARSWGVARLASATARLRELDALSKSGGISGFSPIEAFICEYL